MFCSFMSKTLMFYLANLSLLSLIPLFRRQLFRGVRFPSLLNKSLKGDIYIKHISTLCQRKTRR